ncbi:hypothetical protein GCM10011399_07160 [Subtercola lobariae]|uniref:Beta-lactamase-related domain-containing protein n=1 Tax=Subtercola lobariae TaxID=1588641 RepID=A0A917B3E3_9MICO|nr:hypothetical protein GCM10011399_07160 [Subtercola lobariae]
MSAADAAFASTMPGPIQTWRTSFEASSMSFSVPGTVLAASVGDSPVVAVANGDAVLGSTPVDASDTFHIGSMTKLFTAALIMQLDEEHVLALSDTIDKWFPSAPNGSKITVLMLLEHESVRPDPDRRTRNRISVPERGVHHSRPHRRTSGG